MNVTKKRSNDESPGNDLLDNQPTREGIRPKHCASRVHCSHTCACGRPRSLVRHGRRWHRLGGCRRCVAASAAPIAAPSLKGGGHA
jgi:hypothetical protein